MENDERAKCGTCCALISFKGGSTGNLLRHLKTKHSEIDLTPPVKVEEVDQSADEEEEEQLAFETIENKELAKFVQLLNPTYKLHGVTVPRLGDVSFVLVSQNVSRITKIMRILFRVERTAKKTEETRIRFRLFRHQRRRGIGHLSTVQWDGGVEKRLKSSVTETFEGETSRNRYDVGFLERRSLL